MDNDLVVVVILVNEIRLPLLASVIAPWTCQRHVVG